MNQKGFVNIILVVVIVVLVGIAGYFVLVKKQEPPMQQPAPTFPTTSNTPFQTPPTKVQPQPSVPGENQPQVKYQIFQPGLGNKEILNSIYLFKKDILPKEIKFDDVNFSIKRTEFEKSSTSGFSAYVTISYNNQEQKIGFWHPNDPTKNYYLKTNACSKGEKTYDYVCGGILAVKVKEWNREPTAAEKAKGIRNIYYQTRIFLQELDYDFQSGSWNYAKISLGLYEEEQYPPTTN